MITINKKESSHSSSETIFQLKYKNFLQLSRLDNGENSCKDFRIFFEGKFPAKIWALSLKKLEYDKGC